MSVATLLSNDHKNEQGCSMLRLFLLPEYNPGKPEALPNGANRDKKQAFKFPSHLIIVSSSLTLISFLTKGVCCLTSPPKFANFCLV